MVLKNYTSEFDFYFQKGRNIFLLVNEHHDNGIKNVFKPDNNVLNLNKYILISTLCVQHNG